MRLFLKITCVAVAIAVGWIWYRLEQASTIRGSGGVENSSSMAGVPTPVPAWSVAQKLSHHREHIVNNIGDVVGQKLGAWRNEPDAREQLRLLQELAALVTDENAPEVTRSLSAEDLAGPFGMIVLQHWLAIDPQRAADWLASRPATTSEQSAAVARKLLEDREAFQNYFDALPEGDWKEKVLSSAGSALAAADPSQAVAFAERMKDGEAKNGLLQTAAYEWARRDADAAKDWVEQTGDTALREQLIASAAKGMAEKDPQAAATWLVGSMNNDELIAGTAQGIVRSWAAKDPAQAADWIILFPEGTVRNEALETLINTWSAMDFDAVKAWISNVPDGPTHRAAQEILRRSSLARVQ